MGQLDCIGCYIPIRLTQLLASPLAIAQDHVAVEKNAGWLPKHRNSQAGTGLLQCGNAYVVKHCGLSPSNA